jgi:hypothetical protein
MVVLRHPGQHLVRRRCLTATAAEAVRVHLAMAPLRSYGDGARDAVYFGDHQHVRPIAVLAVWATALFTAWLVVARRREAVTAT